MIEATSDRRTYPSGQGGSTAVSALAALDVSKRIAEDGHPVTARRCEDPGSAALDEKRRFAWKAAIRESGGRPNGIGSAEEEPRLKEDEMGNAEAAKSAYEAFNKGDLETLKEGFAEDCEWQTSDELPLGGLTRGRDAIMANFAQLPNYWSSFSVEASEFIDAGEKVIVSGTQRATGKGGSFEAPFLHLMEYRDGKVVRGEFEGDSAKALKALG